MSPGDPIAVHWRYDQTGRIPLGHSSIPKGPQVTRGILVRLDRDGVVVRLDRDNRRRAISWPRITKIRVIT